MYGKVHFENETGEFKVVECATQTDYERELEAGCRWIEDEPRRFLNLWGERFSQLAAPDCKASVEKCAEGV